MRVITAPDRPLALRMLRWLAIVLLVFDLSPKPAQRVMRTELRGARTARLPTLTCKPGGACAVIRPIAADGGSIRRGGRNDSISVWIAYGQDVPKYRRGDRVAVRDAFHAWTEAGVPLRFVFVSDSNRATVHVVWKERLPARRAGQLTRAVDEDGWLHGAVMELSTRNISGASQDPKTMHAVALHEVGHLIGLEHSADPADIMASWVRAKELSARDEAMGRLLYGKPQSVVALARGR